MISSIDSSAAACPISANDPAPSPSVTVGPSWISRGAFDMDKAWASVFATINSAPSRSCMIMLLTALPPPPPTPMTAILGLRSLMLDGETTVVGCIVGSVLVETLFKGDHARGLIS
ncbi:hypothetical protein D3C86_1494980 [compost metagenome]